MMPSGLSDKLYWRRVGAGLFHCFSKIKDEGGRNTVFESLCGAHNIDRSGGGAMRRPEAFARCAACDVAEMERRGWDESGPMTESARSR